MSNLETSPEFATTDIVVDNYHGLDVPDPFRWLEDHQSPRTRAWIEEQSAVGRAYLEALPGGDVLAPRVAKLLDVEAIGDIQAFGGTV